MNHFTVFTNNGADFYFNGVKIAAMINETLVLEAREYSEEEISQLTKFIKSYKKIIKKLKITKNYKKIKKKEGKIK